MRIAVLPPVGAGACSDPAWMRGFARHAEELGYESLVLPEHPLVIGSYSSRYPYGRSGRMPLANDCPVPDPLDLLAFIAACTTTLGLSTGVLILPAHHPVILAKRLATIDALSLGRVRLGIGVGWMREELEACGAEFESRGRRTDESIDVMRLLWSDSGADGASYEGEFFRFENAHCFPKPVRTGGIPIHVGGHSPASVRRAARRGDGWQPLGLTGEELADALSLFRKEASAAGRDPDSLEVTLSTGVPVVSPESIEKARAEGATRLVVAFLTGDLSEAKDQLAWMAELFGLEPGGPRVIPA
jgi:probable F420-dependent oxidoreductase